MNSTNLTIFCPFRIHPQGATKSEPRYVSFIFVCYILICAGNVSLMVIIIQERCLHPPPTHVLFYLYLYL